ncbi:hypothetical protein CMO90_00305 [Candidatus Woesearchaeota archaeon]|jgi:hypothetical protein|nr:hypothetical protein [Candidatus Woesearchaeota archaeon]
MNELKFSNTTKTADEISNLSDKQLEEIISGSKIKTTSEQLKDAKLKVSNAEQKAKNEYLKETTGLQKIISKTLYSLRISSPERELRKKNSYLLKAKNELNEDVRTVQEVIKKGYNDVIEDEKRKLAIDVKINRKEHLLKNKKDEYKRIRKELSQEELDDINRTKRECELQKSYLDQFVDKNEISSLKADYVLSFKKNDRLKSVLSSQELDLQRLMQTSYDLEGQISELNVLMKRGVAPAKILNSMESAYSTIEECERLKTGVLMKANDVYEAISDIRIVGSQNAVENQCIYDNNSSIARKVQDGFELEYETIKENLGR